MKHKKNTILDELNKEFQSYPEPIRESARKKFWEKFAIDFNLNSNKIEGSTLNYEEAVHALKGKLSSKEKGERDFLEMQAHGIALEQVHGWAKEERPISETDIRELNRIILVKNYWKDAITPDGKPSRKEIEVGKYKETPNHVEQSDGTIFKYSEPEKVPSEMNDLLTWYRKETEAAQDAQIVAVAVEFHYRFVRIHPFDDGNGRVSRLLMNYILLSKGYPPVDIHADDKKRYLRFLRDADKGDLEPLIEYVAEKVEENFGVLHDRCEEAEIDHLGELIKRKIRPPRRLLNIFDTFVEPLYKKVPETLLNRFAALAPVVSSAKLDCRLGEQEPSAADTVDGLKILLDKVCADNLEQTSEEVSLSSYFNLSFKIQAGYLELSFYLNIDIIFSLRHFNVIIFDLGNQYVADLKASLRPMRQKEQLKRQMELVLSRKIRERQVERRERPGLREREDLALRVQREQREQREQIEYMLESVQWPVDEAFSYDQELNAKMQEDMIKSLYRHIQNRIKSDNYITNLEH